VHWIIRLLPGRQMASRIPAIGRGYRQTIVVVDVAQTAGHVGVRVGQSEAGCAVIENSRSPGSNRVARRASRSRDREPRGHVIRYVPADRRGSQEGWLMAPITIRRTEGVVVVDMAGNAGGRRWRHVPTDQSKSGPAVVEYRRRPTYCVMAYRAVRCRKLSPRSRVYRIIRLLPGRQMAARIPAIGRRSRQTIVIIEVAGGARHVSMPIRQQEARQRMVKGGGKVDGLPCVNRSMAGLARS
jgi:hypothetical protein